MNGYIERAKQRLDEIEHTQRANIEKAGRLLASAIEQDRLIYVFGAGGHTSLVAGEMFFRIGGLANIYPIVEYGLTALSQARKFIQLERCLGLGSSLVAASGIGRGTCCSCSIPSASMPPVSRRPGRRKGWGQQ